MTPDTDLCASPLQFRIDTRIPVRRFQVFAIVRRAMGALVGLSAHLHAFRVLSDVAVTMMSHPLPAKLATGR